MARAKKAEPLVPGSVDAIRRKDVTRTDILVKAVGRGDGMAGYYHLRRMRDGDTFYLDKEEDFSDSWMVVVDANGNELEGETERLSALAGAAKRKANAEQAMKRATFTNEKTPKEELEEAEKEFEKAKGMKRERGATKPTANAELSPPDPKRKIQGSSDYAYHENPQPVVNEGPEPQGGRSSDKNVV